MHGLESTKRIMRRLGCLNLYRYEVFPLNFIISHSLLSSGASAEKTVVIGNACDDGNTETIDSSGCISCFLRTYNNDIVCTKIALCIVFCNTFCYIFTQVRRKCSYCLGPTRNKLIRKRFSWRWQTLEKFSLRGDYLNERKDG